MMLHLLEHDDRFEAPRSPRETRDQTARKTALVCLHNRDRHYMQGVAYLIMIQT